MGLLLLGLLLAAGSVPGPALGELRGAAPSPPVGGGVAAAGPIATPVSSPAWFNESGSLAPLGRYSAAMTYDALDGYVLLFGGEPPGAGAPYGDTWAYLENHWQEICSGNSSAPTCAVSPPPSLRASLAYDPAIAKAVEYDWGTGLTYTFADGRWTNASTPVHPPLQDSPSQVAFDPVLGGLALVTSSGALWTFVNGTWRAVPVQGAAPPGRIDAQLFFDPARAQLILFGGTLGDEVYHDVWGFSNGSWTGLPAPAFPPEILASAFDPAFGYDAVLTGGPAGGPVVLWAFSNGSFAQLPTQGVAAPPPALAPAMAYDARDGYLLVFSGEQADPGGATAASSSWAAVDPLEPVGLFLSRPAVIQGDTLRLGALARGGILPYSYVYTLLPPGCAGVSAPTILCRTYLAGTYPVRAEVLDGTWGSVSVSGELLVAPIPTVSVTAEPQVATVGVPVYLNSTVLGGLAPYTFHWNFGDGTNATGQNVTHPFASAGSFNVTLNVLNASNLSTPASEMVYVNPAPALTLFNVTPSVTDANVPVQFSAAAQGGTSPLTYQWVLGDGVGRGIAPAFSYIYPEPGIYRVTVWANDSLGAVATESTLISVRPDPQIGILVGAAPYNLSVTLRAAISGGTAPFDEVWSLGDGSVHSGATVVHVYPAPGSYTVRLTLRDGAGWVASVVRVLDLHPGTPPAPPPPFYETVNGLAEVGAPVGLLLVLVGVIAWYVRRRPPPAEEEVPPEEGAEFDPGFDHDPEPMEPFAPNGLEDGTEWAEG